MKSRTSIAKVYLGRTLRYIFTPALLAFCVTESMAADWNLGPFIITANDVVQIHFLNRNPTPSKGAIPIAVRFLDSTGKTVATAGTDCGPGSDVCLPGSLIVDSQHITTVSLAGSSLKLDPDESMLVQPIVTALGPAAAFLRLVLEQSSSRSPARGVIQYIFNIPAQLRAQIWHLGPVTLHQGERAQFSITYCGPGSVALQMFFGNANGDFNDITPVTLTDRQAASIELDGNATDIAGVPGVIFAGVSGFGLIASGTLDSLGGTLAVIDKASGASKALLSLWGCGGTSSGLGTGDGGGNGGSK